MSSVIFYISLFLLVFVINYFAIRGKKPNYPLIIIGFALLLMMIWLRHNVGTDYQSYLEMYKTANHLSMREIMTSRTEPFVLLVLRFFSSFIKESHFIFLLFGLFSLIPIYLANRMYKYKYLPYSVLTYCIIYLPFSMNGMRQGVAISLIILSIASIVKHKNVCGIISFILACLFHTSSLIMLPYCVIVFVCRKMKRKTAFMTMCATLVLSFVILFFLNKILIENGFDSYKYLLKGASIEKISLSYLYMFVPIIMLLLLSRKYRRMKMVELLEDISLYKELFYSGCIFFVVGTAALYLNRVSLYFMSMSVMVVPIILESITNRKTKFVVKMVYLSYLILFFIQIYLIWGQQEIIPYQTWIIGG